jgi:DNA polymerase-3 subunit alpha
LPNPDDWLPNERLGAEHQAIGFYLSGHPLDDYLPALKRKGCLTLAEVESRVQGGPFVAKLAGSVSSRQERKSQRGNRFAFVQCSDPTGLYEVTMFSDVLEATRHLLDAGSNVILQVEATFEADQLKLLARGVQPIDDAVAGDGGGGLRVFLDGPEAITTVAGLLERTKAEVKSRARGPVHFCLMHPDLPGEVDVLLGDDFPVSPQIKGALKSIGGVVMVEDV